MFSVGLYSKINSNYNNKIFMNLFNHILTSRKSFLEPRAWCKLINLDGHWCVHCLSLSILPFLSPPQWHNSFSRIEPRIGQFKLVFPLMELVEWIFSGSVYLWKEWQKLVLPEIGYMKQFQTEAPLPFTASLVKSQYNKMSGSIVPFTKVW